MWERGRKEDFGETHVGQSFASCNVMRILSYLGYLSINWLGRGYIYIGT